MTTDQATDTSTETDIATDTGKDAPTAWEQSSESYGPAGIVLGGSSSTSMTDTVTDGVITSDVDRDTSTETHSDWIGGGSVTSLQDDAQDTATASSTLAGTDSSTDTIYEGSGRTLGLAGVIVGGYDQDIETGTDTSSGGTTGGETDLYTTTHSDAPAESLIMDPYSFSADTLSEVGDETSASSGTFGESSNEWESMTDTLGTGGVVIGGSMTETYSDGGGSTDTTTATDNVSDSSSMTSMYAVYFNTSIGQESGCDTTTETDTGASQGTGTLTEDLGADGPIADGAESDSISESSGSTTTETGYPIETVTESASDVTMTLTNTATDSATDNETDQEWACETLGTSGAIAGGSDGFTVSDLKTSGYTSTGTGPEDYNDTSSTPNGTATVTASGSSSDFLYQRFGDVLGTGGDIASGSLSYTVTSSDTDAATTTESGTETIADEMSDGPSQTASYDVSTTMPDRATAWETGTEALGGGGTIQGGTASFSWSDGDSLSRDLGVSGIAAILHITEDSTDTYGFGESGRPLPTRPRPARGDREGLSRMRREPHVRF